MTLSQIMKMALRQLDEAPEDLSEYDELFRCYANAGYQAAVGNYLRPREMRVLETDESGRADIAAQGIRRVITLEHADRRCGGEVFFRLEDGGGTIRTVCPGARLHALCEVRYPEMERDSDEPRLPRRVHPALADYVCYRWLSTGSPAKQKRAEVFYEQYLKAMQELDPAGYRSVTRERRLYQATDIRRT